MNTSTLYVHACSCNEHTTVNSLTAVVADRWQIITLPPPPPPEEKTIGEDKRTSCDKQLAAYKQLGVEKQLL